MSYLEGWSYFHLVAKWGFRWFQRSCTLAHCLVGLIRRLQVNSSKTIHDGESLEMWCPSRATTFLHLVHCTRSLGWRVWKLEDFCRPGSCNIYLVARWGVIWFGRVFIPIKFTTILPFVEGPAVGNAVAGLSTTCAVGSWPPIPRLRSLLFISPPWPTLVSACSLSCIYREMSFGIMIDGESHRFSSKIFQEYLPDRIIKRPFCQVVCDRCA